MSLHLIYKKNGKEDREVIGFLKGSGYDVVYAEIIETQNMLYNLGTLRTPILIVQGTCYYGSGSIKEFIQNIKKLKIS